MLNVDIIDDVVQVQDEDAMETARQLAKQEGLMCGISSGAAAWAAIAIGQEAGEQRQADRGRAAGSRRAVSVDEAVSGMMTGMPIDRKKRKPRDGRPWAFFTIRTRSLFIIAQFCQHAVILQRRRVANRFLAAGDIAQ